MRGLGEAVGRETRSPFLKRMIPKLEPVAYHLNERHLQVAIAPREEGAIDLELIGSIDNNYFNGGPCATICAT
jgi:hypothetical protein